MITAEISEVGTFNTDGEELSGLRSWTILQQVTIYRNK
jgi:hypothetical protein